MRCLPRSTSLQPSRPRAGATSVPTFATPPAAVLRQALQITTTAAMRPPQPWTFRKLPKALHRKEAVRDIR